MAIDNEMEEVRMPSTLSFSASFDSTNPLGFLEKVYHFIEKQSNFLKKHTAQKEITTAVTAVKEMLKEAEKKKKTKPMKVEKVKPSTLPFSASFDPSNPLGFLEKVLNFIGKESDFLKKVTAEKEITTSLMAVKEKEKEKESVKQGTLKMKKYGLQIRAPSHKIQSLSRPPIRTSSIFGDEEDENDVEKEISLQASKTKTLKKIEEQRTKALKEDSSAFAYDEVYDDMKQKQVLPQMQDREELKSRYIPNLMKQKERRDKEHEIVYERKLAKERAKEEHLFWDKEKFVTGSYKRKLEEQKKWLAEERLRELREEKDDVTKKKDLSDFYFNIGKNVAFGAKEAKEQRKVEKLEEVRKEEKKRKSPEKEVSSETRVIESSCRRSMEPQEAEQASSEKKMDSYATKETDSSIKETAKEATNNHRKREDAISAAKERFLARKKAKIEE